MDAGNVDAKMLSMLERVLDLSSRRHQLIAANIANVDTPGFHTKDIDFYGALKEAIASNESQSSNSSLAGLLGFAAPTQLDSQPQVIEPEGLALRNDGNNVNADREMANMASNSLQYTLATELLGREFSVIRGAIREGK
ncbi:MAG TPA: flagellar basal body rod protein FlgB [Blastocatellia bacterium]|nr:flagellar basal body rod protein FlgB [Blastocatellia bacterium]